MGKLRLLNKTIILFFCVATAAASTEAQDLPLGFQATPVGDSWDVPVCLRFLADGRLLVTEKEGRLWLVENDQKKNLVLDLTAEVLSRGDRGLLSVAAHPDFAQNGYLYLLYTVDPNGDGNDLEEEAFGRLTRYSAQFAPDGTLLADANSRWVMLGTSWSDGIPSLSLTHGPGTVGFLGDGSLVLSAGDGAAADHVDDGGSDPGYFGGGFFDPLEDQGAFRAQYLNSYSGKILRLDPATGLGLADNPFYTGNPADKASRVFVRGLRNPYRFSLLPGTGLREDLLISDVGWSSWEEINLVRGGENCGWPCFEGDLAQPAYAARDVWGYCNAGMSAPWLSWSHSIPGTLGFTGNCATATVVYQGSSYPPLYQGALFFCDYEREWLRCARLNEQKQITSILSFGTAMGGLVDLTTDPSNGDLVYASLDPIAGQRIRRIRYLGADQPPVAVAEATPRSGGAPLSVQFDAGASYDPESGPVSYVWDFGDGASSTAERPSHTYTGAQNYSAQLTVTDAALQSATASVLITPGNTPPQITQVLAPLPNALYTAGEVVALAAQAEDAEDGAAGRLLTATWHVNLIHDHHTHPDWQVLSGLSASFQTEEHGDGTYYEILLEVTDSRGLSDWAKRYLYDTHTEPCADITYVSDASLRIGQELSLRGELLFPGPWTTDPEPTLTWDFGDGSPPVSFRPVSHGQEVAVTHQYRRGGDFTVTLTARAGNAQHQETLPVSVVPPRPAVAIFAPLVVERWIPWPQQEALASGLADNLRAEGLEVAVFHYDQQEELAAWMAGYQRDKTRDALVILDAGPAALYAGENDGSLLENWLETRNGVVWTGQQPFFEYVDAWGQGSSAGAGNDGPTEVLDAAQPGLCLGQGWQNLVQPAAGRDLPSLQPFQAYKGLRLDRIGPAWSVGRLYAQDAAGASDALVLRHVRGGFFAQFYCTPEAGLPRLEVLTEFLEAYLLRPGLVPPQ